MKRELRLAMHARVRSLLLSTALLVAGLIGSQPWASAAPGSLRQSRDGVIKLYGACGPQTALRKVADAWQLTGGIPVRLVCGPEQEWSAQAQQDADIIWGTSEQSMTAFLVSFPSFDSKNVLPIYLRPTIIAVKRGNPRGIQSFDDLLKPGIRIVVTEGSGVANTSGTGTWEDVAGRLGRLEDVLRFRANIVAFSTGSGASFRAFQALDADAWITWPEWAVDHPEVLQAIPISQDRRIWRDLTIAIAVNADPQAAAFATFLLTETAQALMASAGYVR